MIIEGKSLWPIGRGFAGLPPPPPPPPPPKKKTKKELEREEKWEEELVESVGIEAWAAMSDIERRDMRRAKFDMEMGGWD